MEAKLKNHGEISIVSIHGTLDIEHTQSFREVCRERFLSNKVIFNMEKANFVGSTGIQPLLDAIKLISEGNTHGLKIVCMKSEFRRIFQNVETQNLEIFDSESAAIESFSTNGYREA